MLQSVPIKFLTHACHVRQEIGLIYGICGTDKRTCFRQRPAIVQYFHGRGTQELPQREAMSKQDLRNYFLNDLYPLMMALTMVWGDMMSSRIAA